MSPREFNNAVTGWEEERRDRLEFDRAMTFFTVRVHMGKKAKIKPTDMYRFPWDGEQVLQGKARMLSGDEKQTIKERLLKIKR